MSKTKMFLQAVQSLSVCWSVRERIKQTNTQSEKEWRKERKKERKRNKAWREAAEAWREAPEAWREAPEA